MPDHPNTHSKLPLTQLLCCSDLWGRQIHVPPAQCGCEQSCRPLWNQLWLLLPALADLSLQGKGMEEAVAF